MLTYSLLTRVVTQSAGSLALTIGFLCSNAAGHTFEDLKNEMQEVSDPLARVTKAYENAQPGEIREQLHATQHEMLIARQHGEMKLKCIELLEKIPALERRVRMLEKSGKADEADQVQLLIDKSRAFVTVGCPTPLR